MKRTPGPSRRQRRRDLVCLSSFVLAAALLLLAAPAVADLVVCGPGTGAGQCQSPQGVAVDREAGILYVADKGNDRIDVFDADIGASLTTFGVGQLNDPVLIAVDNDPASEAQGDVYVVDSSNTVKRFNPAGVLELTIPGPFEPIAGLAVGTGGVVHVLDAKPEKPEGKFEKRLLRFTHLGAPVGPALVLGDEPLGGVRGFAVDSTGSFYVANDGVGGATPAVRKYDSSGTLLKTFHHSFNIQTLAVDAANNLFVGDSSGVSEGGETAVYQYNSTGTLQRVLYGNGTLKVRPVSLVPHSSPEGDVFAAEAVSGLGRVVHYAFEPPGPVVHPDPKLTKADPIGNTKATLNARVNPEGAFTTARLEYVDHATYLGEGFANPQETSNVAVGTGFVLQQITAQIGCVDPATEAGSGKCLVPETTYHFRAVASNSKGTAFGPEATFETKPPFEIEATFASEVGAQEAKVHAEVNPVGIAATGHFEYVDQATFEASGFEEATEVPAVGADPLDFGSGSTAIARSVQLHSLEPDTTYRYRVVVADFFTTKAGPEQSFRTFPLPTEEQDTCANKALRIGPSAHLPDCRAYEMVSPVDKEGGEVLATMIPPASVRPELIQSAAEVPAEGRGIAYSSARAFGDAISAPLTSQYMASRHPLGDPEEGWRSHAISPPREGAPFSALFWLKSQYQAFSEDLRWGWLLSDSEPALVEEAIASYPNLYRRDNASDGYEAICPAEPSQEPDDLLFEPQGFSADSGVIAFRANDKLTAEASSGKNAVGEPVFQLYGCAGGELRLLSVLPAALGGGANDEHSAAGTSQDPLADHYTDSLHNAVSTDGQRVYWTASDSANPQGTLPGRIYLRENPFGEGAECAAPSAPCTVAVSEAVGGPGADAPAEFWTASLDGAVAIFRFTKGPLAGNLYEFDATAEAEPTELIAKGVSSVAGWSEDAKRIYFVSSEALAPGALEGKANLYLHDTEKGGGPALVAALPGGTAKGCREGGGIGDLRPTNRCTRATPDGRRLAFVSHDPLTGYDNAEAASGEPTSQVFLYDSSANGGAGELLCVSCNQSGGRPAGLSRIPGWESAFHATRALSADGRRLFFESYDALLAQDTNSTLDVYQWEEAGKGSCDSGDQNHFPQNGGCISLISSGKSPRDTEFIDASADGQDVFIRTAAGLLPQDPGLLDLYDARAGGGFPPPEPPRPPCEGEACQSPPAPPQPSAPSSSSFRGPGNQSAGNGTKPRCPKGKRRVTRRGKPRCVKRAGKRVQKKNRRARR